MDVEQNLSLEETVVELKKLVRRVDELQKTVDLLYKDREILEDIQASIQALKSATVSTREHHDNNLEEIKTEIKDSQFHIEEKVDKKVGEVKDEIKEKTVIVKSEKENIFKKIQKMLQYDRKTQAKPTA